MGRGGKNEGQAEKTRCWADVRGRKAVAGRGWIQAREAERKGERRTEDALEVRRADQGIGRLCSCLVWSGCCFNKTVLFSFELTAF